jgi:inosine/xanthosine triphosphatase
MKIAVGSKNTNKINAVKNAAALYPKKFPNAEVVGVDVKVEQFGHPKNIKEIVEGAIDRAKQAFVDCDYSFGLESGMIEVPHTKTGYVEIQACIIYDGKNTCIGFCEAFEWPVKAAELILKGEADGSAAIKKIGLTEHEKIGDVKGGAIGLLTGGRITREDQVKHSIIMAMMQLEHPELY